MTLRHQGGGVYTQKLVSDSLSATLKTPRPTLSVLLGNKILDHWFALCTAFHSLSHIPVLMLDMVGCGGPYTHLSWPKCSLYNPLKIKYTCIFWKQTHADPYALLLTYLLQQQRSHLHAFTIVNYYLLMQTQSGSALGNCWCWCNRADHS